MKRLSLALGLLVACAAVHQPLCATVAQGVAARLGTPKLFQTDQDKLCKYAYKGNLKKGKKVIAKGAKVNALGEWTGLLKRRRGTPLHAAIEGDRIEVAIYLLAHGAQVNVPIKLGNTPFQSAALHSAARGSVAMVQLLILNGAEVNVPNEYGWTLLHSAAYRGSVDVAQLLIRNGADLDAKTKGGDTPLHLAAHRGTKEMAKFLVISGANPYIKNRDGRYPYQLTRSGIAYRHIAKILDPEGRHKKEKATRKAARKEKRREGRVEFFRKIGVRD